MDEELFQAILLRTRDECVLLAIKATHAIQEKHNLTPAQTKDIGKVLGDMTGAIVSASLRLCIDLCREEARR